MAVTVSSVAKTPSKEPQEVAMSAGVGLLGEAASPFPLARESGEHCKLPSGVWAENWPLNDFLYFEVSRWLILRPC